MFRVSHNICADLFNFLLSVLILLTLVTANSDILVVLLFLNNSKDTTRIPSVC